ncbi:MAG: DUF4143 domain-containing protein, partial [Endomicrobium sp.]|nr:DUF4143 domain-containing protein [Endomicrobium sp.]
LAKEIFPYLKISVDENRFNGKNANLYLLTGSANLMAVPSLAKALVGRMSVFTLLPFSSCEYYETNTNFIDRLWKDDLKSEKFGKYDIIDAISNATFPEIAVDKKINRKLWFDNYLNLLLQKDIKSIDDIKNPYKIISLLANLAVHIGSPLNKSKIQNEIGLDNKTFEKYLSVLFKTFIISEIKPWAKPAHIEKRFIRAPKIYFTDTNFMLYLLKRDIEEIYRNDKAAMGHIFENFIATEIIKNASLLIGAEISVFNPEGKEVDFAIEYENGKTLGIEVKLDSSLSQKDFNNIYNMRYLLKDKFHKGIILYTGDEIISMGDKIWAVPASYLWKK